jgi:hypothetical protein
MQLRTRRVRLLARVSEIRTDLDTTLDAVVGNAREIDRGLEQLSENLRQAQASFFEPKRQVTVALKSISGNLGELNILKPEKVAAFQEKVDEYSDGFDELAAKYLGMVNET